MKLKILKCERLEGSINISGSKNTTLPILAASMLSKKTVVLKNIPLITDVLIMIDIMKSMGVKIKRENHKVIINAKKFNPIINSNDVQKLRGSYYLIGSCLARYNICSIKMPGGCNFTSRPIDLHIKAFQELGYDINFHKDTMYIKKGKTNIKEVTIEKKSVGTSINVLLSCSLMISEIKINNILFEPEVIEVIKFLEKIGINMVKGSNNIYIRNNHIKKKIKFKIVSDRIETGSYMLLAVAIKNSHLTIKHAPIKYMESVINVVKKLGCEVMTKKDTIIVNGNNINGINLDINEYPSFPTDLQQILSVVLLNAKNESHLKDNIYPERISHIRELNKMKGNIKYINNEIIIRKSKLIGTKVNVKDLRCGFALIVAGSIATNQTILENAEIILRGYEKPLIKLKNIGIKITEYMS